MNDIDRAIRTAQSNLITMQAMKIRELEQQIKLLEAIIAELKAAGIAPKVQA